MEDFSTYLDLPVSEMQLKMVGHLPNDSESQYFSVSNDQMHVVQPMPSNPLGFGTLMVPNKLVGNNDSAGGIMSSNPIWTSSQLVPTDASMLKGGNTSLAVKRKAEVGPLSYNSISQPSLFPSKRPAYNRTDANLPMFLQPPAQEKRNASVQSELHSPGLQAQRNVSVQSESRSPGLQAQSSQSKKNVRNDSIPGNTGPQRGQTAKKQATRVVSASKARPESSAAVRSKMKESLTAALNLVLQKPENASHVMKKQTDPAVTRPVPVNSQDSEFNSTSGSGNVPAAVSEVFTSVESALDGKTNDSQVFPADIPPNVNNCGSEKIFQDFQYSSFLPDVDIAFSDNFLVKDDLLQGNGLSWAFELDVQMEEKQAQDAEKPQSVIQEDDGNKVKTDEAKLTPNYLATQIEAELFKLFGGVNKKYKEKGRSLLFNLKDRSNPELRERVMSGEIPPDRLCSMSAEELASKELSEWRMAKAEEFAQMVVLPDTDADMRRLVKKTHKGEYQVEVERDDGIVTEVSGGTSMLTHRPPKKETESPPKTSTEDKENVSGSLIDSGKKEFSDSLIIPTDGTDLMQGIMVDELKDPNLLPPIVSLDEFMESLNAEPPFENLSADAGVRTSLSNDEKSKALTNSRTSDRTSESPRDASSRKPILKKHEVDESMKLTGSSLTQEVLLGTSLKVEYIWQGKLQLTISSSVTVGGVFQSGEKTSTKEWSTSLEIKGKVRIDAFEKFLQELPMSRTRAVMVLQFILKDESSQNERPYLSEAIDSYTTDERLGYAEPASGVELYLYPPTSRIADMINKHMPKQRFEANKSMENGLIGIVVWRRIQISKIMSPNSSSHHKHSSKKGQQSFPPKRVQNVNVNIQIRTPPPVLNNNIARAKPELMLEDEDDIPPGFGPVAAARAAKDDDDLPEFNFSSNLNPHVPKFPQQKTTPVDKVRELIQKYGKSDSSEQSSSSLVGVEPWKDDDDDDDDDIPEWRPQVPFSVNHQPYLVAHGPPPLHAIPTNQHIAPIVTRTPPSGSTWPRPPGPLHGVRWRQS